MCVYTSPLPCEVISDHTHPKCPAPNEVTTHHHKLHIVGLLLAAVICHGDTIDCNLTTPLTKQVGLYILYIHVDYTCVDASGYACGILYKIYTCIYYI